MEIFIKQVSECFNKGLLMPAMIGLFTLPDAAAAVEYGLLAPSKRYPMWFDSFVPALSQSLPGELAWSIRNALMHETAMNWRGRGFDFDRVMFYLPTGNSFSIDFESIGGTTDVVRSLELKDVVPAVLQSAYDWLQAARKDPVKDARLEGLMQVRPNGLAPWVVGIPLIG